MSTPAQTDYLGSDLAILAHLSHEIGLWRGVAKPANNRLIARHKPRLPPTPGAFVHVAAAAVAELSLDIGQQMLQDAVGGMIENNNVIKEAEFFKQNKVLKTPFFFMNQKGAAQQAKQCAEENERIKQVLPQREELLRRGQKLAGMLASNTPHSELRAEALSVLDASATLARDAGDWHWASDVSPLPDSLCDALKQALADPATTKKRADRPDAEAEQAAAEPLPDASSSSAKKAKSQ